MTGFHSKIVTWILVCSTGTTAHPPRLNWLRYSGTALRRGSRRSSSSKSHTASIPSRMAQPQPVLPRGAWDSHLHIADPERWPLADDAPYTPKKADLDACLAFERSIGIDHICIIAMSIYGTDNRCSINALKRLNGKARGIACIDPHTITDAELDELHGVGFRGVRLNLRTRSQSLGAEEWLKLLRKYADRLRRLDWVIQVFVSMDQYASIAPIFPELGIKVVFDHLGHPEAGETPAAAQPGCAELYTVLAQNKNAYIKLSGLYRLEGVPGLEEHIKKLLRMVPDQIVWASDWPHSAGSEHNPGGDPKATQEFLTPDIPKFIAECVRWCEGDEGLMQKIWVENPRRLWDYPFDD
ncbi:hypothetical protein DFH08DRAFT_892482 [Mycena albidolilacea]|uniref:Amidohydrolase-related domain-containing protein n=1 Tax=Mycena albidolilacea TaxID=1033008 RepID=A0AAD6ZD97_9AGAR|nr:hypothetical protein DFH08DRAFT_892482 [Mycena albidolilacea]